MLQARTAPVAVSIAILVVLSQLVAPAVAATGTTEITPATANDNQRQGSMASVSTTATVPENATLTYSEAAKAWNTSNTYQRFTIGGGYGYAISGDDSTLYKISLDDGSVLDQTSISYSGALRVMRADSTGVYIISNGGGVYRYNTDLTQEWNNTGFSGTASTTTGMVLGSDRVIMSSDGGSGIHRYGLMKSDGSQDWSQSHNSQIWAGHQDDDGSTYVGQNGNLLEIDPATGSGIETNVSTSLSLIVGVAATTDDFYPVGYDVKKANRSTGNTEWTFNGGSGRFRKPAVDDSYLYASNGSGYYKLDKSDGNATWKMTGVRKRTYEDGDYVYILNKDGHLGKVAKFQPSIEGSLVSGSLVDQSGSPVREKGMTVEIWGVRESAFSTQDAQELNQSAKELLEEASNTIPDGWDPDRDLEAEYESFGSHYIVSNSKTEWETGLLSEGVDPKPRLQFDESETITLSCWDPHDSADSTGAPVDGSWQGSTDSCTFRIERISPTGEVQSSWTVDSSPQYETFGASFSGFTKKHEVVQTKLPTSFYRVTLEDKDSDFQILFEVGEASDHAQMVKEDLTDQANRKTEQAAEIAQRLQEDTMWRTTVTTDENGTWSAEIPSGVVMVQAQAYKTPGGLDHDANWSDVRTYLSAVDVNQTSILLSTSPERVSPPASDVEIEVVRADATAWKDAPEEWADRLDAIVQERLNESLTELESFYQDRLENQTRETIEQRFGDVRDLILANDDLREAYLELSEFEEVPEVDELSDEQARTEIRLMRQAFLAHDSRVPMESPETDIGTDTISVEFPVAGEIAEASPEIVWSNGTVQNVSEDYWHAESGLLSSGSTLVIDDYPVGEGDAAVAKFRANVVTADGEVGRNGVSIANPRYTGDIPQINAIDVDALQPGADEPVTVRLRPEPGTGFEGVTGAKAISPTNEDLETTITDSGAVQFSTSGAGYHFIRIEYEATGGDPFTLSFRLKARDHPRSETPTIQLVETPYGRTPVAGAGLESARYETDDSGQEHTFVAVTPSGDGHDVGKLEIRPGSKLSGTQNTINIALVEGEDEEAVNRHSRVLIHLPDGIGTPSGKLLTESMVRANGNPVTSEGTLQGEITDRDGNKQTLEVITDDSGQATIEVDEDPGWGDRPWWWISTNLPSFESPLTLWGIFGAAGDHAPSPASSGVGLLGLIGGAAAARRFQT